MNLMSLIEVPIAWVLTTIHSLLEPIFGSGPGVAWPLAIVGLTIVIRLLIMPLFFRQIKASRGMQIVQPELQALQKKYKGKTDPVSRQAQQQEMMALYKKYDVNPMASCLPILVQMPIFFGLFSVLRSLSPLANGTYKTPSIGPLTAALAGDAEASTVFGAPLSSTFLSADNYGNPMTVRIVTVVLIIFMASAQFFSMRQLTMKNMSASAKDNPMFRSQMMMMYALPVIFALSGFAFQVGLLLYWTVSNLWAIGQQFYTIRKHPVPGSEAYKAKQRRDAEKRARKGIVGDVDDRAATEEVEPQGQRVQPMSKARAKKKGVNPNQPLEDAQNEDQADETSEETPEDETPPEEVRGKDGLTDAERAQRRYEQRAAQREAARRKRAEAERRRKANQKKDRYNTEG